MAIRHCSVKKGRAGKGAAHALYVQGIGRYAERDDVAFIEHGNMPAFASADPHLFWKAADANERANGRAYCEIEFAIPRELETEKEQIKFAQRFTDKVVGVGHAYTLAIHDKAAADGGRNVHAHLMFTERKNDGIERDAVQFFKRANPKQPEKGGAGKDRAFNNRQFVQDTRALYQKVVNRELEARGVDLISMTRDNRREPEPKLGPKHARAGRDFRREARAEVIRDLRAARSEFNGLVQEFGAKRSEIIDLTMDLKTAVAERDAIQAKAAAKAKQEAMQAKAAERLAAFRASRGKELERPVPAAPAAPSVEELTAQSYAGVLHDLQVLDERWTAAAPNTERGMYVGRVLLVTDFHVAQDAGRHEAAVHERAHLEGDVKEGDRIIIQYDSGRGKVSPERNQQRHRGRGL